MAVTACFSICSRNALKLSMAATFLSRTRASMVLISSDLKSLSMVVSCTRQPCCLPAMKTRGFSTSFTDAKVKVMTAYCSSSSKGIWSLLFLLPSSIRVGNAALRSCRLVGEYFVTSSSSVVWTCTCVRRRNSPSDSRIPKAFCTKAFCSKLGFSMRSSLNEASTVWSAFTAACSFSELCARTESYWNLASTGWSRVFMTSSAPSIIAWSSISGRNSSSPRWDL
mmetsp:Transcript_38159/g.83411  ORF Transcript_38159/g.83411 Transcript_38159/m.83411 type:complete len:224 (-) Transcript_38159:335-1006(-)